MINRYMRLFVFFDLPVVSELEKYNYRKFREFLLDNGFIMIQYSVYIRICRNQDDLVKQTNRIKKNCPIKGNIRLLQITENQFENMEIIRGEQKEEEKYSIDPLIVIE